ncbi:MAG: GNAT family N-acetyltransferase [Clostridia bacterium]|nr:GNAT family N-acetyltransferase [Clostridia bacterium]
MFIEKNDLIIRNATEEDACQLMQWWNDGKIMAHAGYPKGLNITKEKIVSDLAEDSDDTRRRLIIEYKKQSIGEMSYRNLGQGSVEIGIKICVEVLREKGLGTQILKLFIQDLFETYLYEKIVLDTNLENKRAQHVYEKLGFKKVRVNYNAFKNQMGEVQSSVDYELLKGEWHV